MLAKELARRGLRVAIIAFGDPSELPAEIDGVQIVPRPPYKFAQKRLVGKALEACLIWLALWRAPARTVVYRCASLELALVGIYTKIFGRRLVFSTANVVDFDFGQIARKRRDVFLYRLGMRLADDIVVQTEEQVGLCQRSFARTPHLIPSLSPVLAVQSAEPEAFLWIGRLVWYKQPLAYVELARAVPEARFWMVGVPSTDGAEQGLADEVFTLAQGMENLELLEPRPHHEIGELMDRAVASVNTATFEGMPNVLLEAWSRGVPALVLHHDPDGVVNDEGLGGFAAGSPQMLAELARSLWQNRSDRGDLARRCMAYVATHHSPDVVAGHWAALLGRPQEDAAEPQAKQSACAG
jgi:glycosyltransferase involved in cell wall biosynthesis